MKEKENDFVHNENLLFDQTAITIEELTEGSFRIQCIWCLLISNSAEQAPPTNSPFSFLSPWFLQEKWGGPGPPPTASEENGQFVGGPCSAE